MPARHLSDRKSSTKSFDLQNSCSKTPAVSNWSQGRYRVDQAFHCIRVKAAQAKQFRCSHASGIRLFVLSLSHVSPRHFAKSSGGIKVFCLSDGYDRFEVRNDLFFGEHTIFDQREERCHHVNFERAKSNPVFLLPRTLFVASCYAEIVME